MLVPALAVGLAASVGTVETASAAGPARGPPTA
jgi:hypothetical protein